MIANNNNRCHGRGFCVGFRKGLLCGSCVIHMYVAAGVYSRISRPSAAE
jgi:hypothetical protein